MSTIGHVAAEKSAFNMAQLSRLNEGTGVRAVYMAERMTRQLGMGKTWCMYLHCSLPCSLMRHLERSLICGDRVSVTSSNWWRMVISKSTSGL